LAESLAPKKSLKIIQLKAEEYLFIGAGVKRNGTWAQERGCWAFFLLDFYLLPKGIRSILSTDITIWFDFSEGNFLPQSWQNVLLVRWLSGRKHIFAKDANS